MPPEAALYYPHAQFCSTAWVKAVLLFWEQLARPVGKDRPDDESDIRELQDAGLIVDIESEPYRADSTRAFGGVVEDILREHGCIPRAIPEVRGLRGRAHESIVAAREDIARRLEAEGRTDAATTLRTDPDRALTIYVIVASGVIAEQRNLAPVTDDPLFTALAMLRNLKAARPNRGTPQSSWGSHMEGGLLAAELLVPTPSPEEVAALSVKRLLEIRDELAESRRRLRKCVMGRAKAIASLPSAEAIQKHVKAFAREVQADVDAKRDALGLSKSDNRWSVMRFTAPAALAVGLLDTAAFPIMSPLVGAGLMGVGLAGWVMGEQKGEVAEPTPHAILELQSAIGADRKCGLEEGLKRLFRS